MTFQKTSLVLLLALPLAAVAADSPPSEPDSIPAILLLQAVKDAFFPSSSKKNVAKKPSAVRGNVLKQDDKNFEEDDPL